MERHSLRRFYAPHLHQNSKQMRLKILISFVLCAAVSWSAAQTATPTSKARASKPATPASSAAQKQQARKLFVLNVVKSAVALPQPDPQDRLRVLSSAASVVASVQPETARSLAKEGARVESDIIASGNQPAVSILSGGQVDCPTMMPPQGERNLAVNMTTDSLKQVLGAGCDDALAKDVVAKGIASTAGQPGEVEHPEEESVSVLQAMDNKGKDRTEEISKLPSSLRAREAAAHGFAAGTSGDKKLADRYFDIAFSAVDNVWSNRTPENNNAAAVVEEVSEAAAHVNPVAALQRSQKLQDPSAQAISMLAVARVVVGQQ